MSSNNHPSRNAASAVLKEHHEQYKRLEQIAYAINDKEAKEIHNVIYDLIWLRSQVKVLNSINKSKQS